MGDAYFSPVPDMPPASCATLDPLRLEPAKTTCGCCVPTKRPRDYKGLYEALLENSLSIATAHQANRKAMEADCKRLADENHRLKADLERVYAASVILAQTAQADPYHPIHRINQPEEHDE